MIHIGKEAKNGRRWKGKKGIHIGTGANTKGGGKGRYYYYDRSRIAKVKMTTSKSIQRGVLTTEGPKQIIINCADNTIK